jgi:hypothetical protein
MVRGLDDQSLFGKGVCLCVYVSVRLCTSIQINVIEWQDLNMARLLQAQARALCATVLEST